MLLQSYTTIIMQHFIEPLDPEGEEIRTIASQLANLDTNELQTLAQKLKRTDNDEPKGRTLYIRQDSTIQPERMLREWIESGGIRDDLVKHLQTFKELQRRYDRFF